MDVVRLLLGLGADVNAGPGRTYGCTPLQGACSLPGNGSGGGGGHVVGLVRLLLDSGADVNAPGSMFKGGTALHAACAKGRTELVRRLLDAGADVNGEAGWGRLGQADAAADGCGGWACRDCGDVEGGWGGWTGLGWEGLVLVVHLDSYCVSRYVYLPR